MSGQKVYLSYLGALALACLVLGGGTQKGLSTVFVLEFLYLPAIYSALVPRGQGGIDKPVVAFLLLLAICCGIQFLPNPFRESTTDLPLPAALTGDAGRSIDSVLFVACVAALFVCFQRVGSDAKVRVLRWVLFGATINLVLALIQFSASQPLLFDIFPYKISAGFFANSNHFSSLLFALMPFMIYQFATMRKLVWALPATALVVFVEFSAGSLAGIYISVACALVSLALVVNVGKHLKLALLLLVVAGGAILAANPANILDVDPDDPLDRPKIAWTTLDAIAHNLPMGSGLGTFDLVYPSSEADVDVSGTYVNHAHNDLFEILLEAGVLGGVLIAAYVTLLVIYFGEALRSPLRMAAFTSILFLLVHSLVDYPLRTMALAVVFAFANAVYFSRDDIDIARKMLPRHGSRS